MRFIVVVKGPPPPPIDNGFVFILPIFTFMIKIIHGNVGLCFLFKGVLSLSKGFLVFETIPIYATPKTSLGVKTTLIIGSNI